MSALTKDLVAIGFNEPNSKFLGDTQDYGISATGIIQTTAYAIWASVNFVSTVAAGVDDGLRLPAHDATPYDVIYIYNNSADVMKVYPAVGEYWGASAVNVPIVINPYNRLICVKTTPGRWISIITGLNPSSGATLGTPPNYAYFDPTGHLTFAGTAKPWDDLRVEPVVRAPAGANVPAFEQWFTDGAGSRGVYLYSFTDAVAGSENEIHFTIQMPHSWDSGPIYFHVHWIGNVADTAAAPYWGLEYTFKEPGGTFGNTAYLSSDGLNYTSTGNDVDIVQYKHYISKLTVINPGATNDGLSSILIGRLWRASAAAQDTYNQAGNKCGLLYIDCHYSLSSVGSTDEYAK